MTLGPPMSMLPLRSLPSNASVTARSTSVTAMGCTWCSSQLGTGCTTSSVAS